MLFPADSSVREEDKHTINEVFATTTKITPEAQASPPTTTIKPVSRNPISTARTCNCSIITAIKAGAVKM